MLQTVTDHEEFKDMNTGVSRLSEERHYSASAQGNEGQTCAGDHGTHVAALAAGYERGAAKEAEIVSGTKRIELTCDNYLSTPWIIVNFCVCFSISLLIDVVGTLHACMHRVDECKQVQT
jgi:hypothetical protein